MRKPKTSTKGKSVKRDARFGIFSFFTGVEFLDLGFEDAGFTPMMANEIDNNFSRVYCYSHEQMKRPLPRFGLQTGDVCAYLDDVVKKKELSSRLRVARSECDLIGFIGGPPCPDFSVAGSIELPFASYYVWSVNLPKDAAFHEQKS